MSLEQFIFYIFASVLMVAAVMVVAARNPVHAALFLILAFFNCACIWMFAEAEFLAISLVLVYVGAVMVLFLFVVMMLDVDMTPLREGFVRYLPVGVSVAAIMLVEIWMVVGSSDGFPIANSPVRHGADYSNTHELGSVLYTTHLYPFEIAAVILLVAMVAAIALSLRKRSDKRTQVPSQQIQVRRQDRVRLVKMKAEKLS